MYLSAMEYTLIDAELKDNRYHGFITLRMLVVIYSGKDPYYPT